MYSLDYLSNLLTDYCEYHGIEPACAMELAVDETLPSHHRRWFSLFVIAWELAENADS